MTEQAIGEEKTTSQAPLQPVTGENLLDLAISILKLDAGAQPDQRTSLGVMGMVSLLGILNMVEGLPARSSLHLPHAESQGGQNLEGLLSLLQSIKGSGGKPNMAALLPLLNLLASAPEGKERNAQPPLPEPEPPKENAPQQEERRFEERERKLGPSQEGWGGGHRDRGYGNVR